MPDGNTSSTFNRREVLRLSLLSSIATLACRRIPIDSAPTNPSKASLPPPVTHTLGPLVADPSNVIDLPAGFKAVVIQQAGDTMSCGHRVPGQPDGMTCLQNELGQLVLLRNHELSGREWFRNGQKIEVDYHIDNTPPALAYNPEMYGGVTRVVLDPNKLAASFKNPSETESFLVHSNLVLTGTEFNCSGGAIPNGWVTCEETDRPNHGYAFQTLISDQTLVNPDERRIDSWGRLKREGVTVHPNTGLVYMTEDHKDGRFYRFVPDSPSTPMGSGTLQAMVLDGLTDTDPEEPLIEGSTWPVQWIDVPDPQAVDQPCREQSQALGAARFNRCEGSVWDGESIWFIASTAGPVNGGQIFRYQIETDTLTLWKQVTDRSVLSMPDNVTLAPWGDLITAEDNYNGEGGATHQHVRGITSNGDVYDLCRNPNNAEDDPGAEFSGPCFSPDGQYFFVNIQGPHNVTIAVTGPWPTAQ